MAIRKGEAHVAGIHLLDPETREYNVTYVRKFLAGQDAVLYPFLKRTQGWMLPKGNPLGIESVGGIAEKGADYANRQKGAGTRILFDLLLKEAGLSADDVNGYDREMFSHLSVAAEVKGNDNAAGLGIFPAARAMGLDFIPVADENYDLLMTKAFFESEKGNWLRSVIQSEAFKAEVAKIGGYAVVENPEPIFF
ncbi:substrate-binding domain-containing protein [Mesobacillus boroniphilus]|uniref:Molybdopterin biosynthesis protein MoeA n=1 Tax=Mesobacillus boroniphilus JCM 21738 TaxID=1294265 RepID=W4RKR1_9BACI|nr:molybdopterin biosynthesis protein MoeA [Mesobacillus boroniphilus JCM 21738]